MRRLSRLAKVGVGAVYTNITVQLLAPVMCAGWPPLGFAKGAALMGVATAFAVYFYRTAPPAAPVRAEAPVEAAAAA